MFRTRLSPVLVVFVSAMSSNACGENRFVRQLVEDAAPAEGELATALPNPTFLIGSGDSVSLHSVLGERLTLVNFFHTWCAPCKQEMPELQRLHEAWSARGVGVVSVAIEPRSDELDQWISEYGLTFPVLHGDGGPDWADLRSEIGDGVPYSVLVDASGTMRFFFRGYRSYAATEEMIQTLFAVETAAVAVLPSGAMPPLTKRRTQ